MSEKEKIGEGERGGDVPDMIALTSFSAIPGLWIWAAIRMPFLRSSARKKSPEPGWMVMVLGVELVGGGDMVHLRRRGLSGVAACLVLRLRFSWGFMFSSCFQLGELGGGGVKAS